MTDLAPAPHAEVLALRLPEWASCPVPAETLLTNGQLDIYPHIEGKGYFTVRISGRDLCLFAGGHVGIIPINDQLILEVVPRVPLGNLSRLLEVSGEAPKMVAGTTRTYAQGGELYPSLVSIYATALSEALNEIAALGWLKEYELRETATSFPHGRVLTTRTLQQFIPRGQMHKASIAWFQRAIDVPVNRCLLFAVHRLAEYAAQVSSSLPTGERRRIAVMLNQAHHLLHGVQLDLTEGFLRDPLVVGTRSLPSLRSYYGPALELAKMIIAGEAVVVDSPGTQVRLPSLLVDMSTVTEAYLRQILVRRAAADGWSNRVLDGNRHVPHGAAKRSLLDSGVDVEATPDIVLTTGTPHRPVCSVLIEVKYKPAKAQPERDDLNQAVGYGVSYRAANVVIAQPKAGSTSVLSGLRPLGTLAGMKLWQYVFDLEGTDLSTEERLWGDRMSELLVE